MKLLACLLAVLLLAAGAVAADPTDAMHYRAVANALGLPESVPIVERDLGEINAYFTPGGLSCGLFFCQEVPQHIALSLPAEWPLEWKLAVLAHEIAHYHWRELGSIPAAEEWDADEWGAMALCRVGVNGPEAAAGALAAIGAAYAESTWAIQPGSQSHGSLVQRIRAVAELRCAGRPAPEA